MIPSDRWITLVSYATGLEADIARAALDEAGIPAQTRGYDAVGIFGPGFQGPTARGFDILVPAAAADQAWAVLARAPRAD